MTPTEAREVVTLLGATASRPALTEPEVDAIVARHRVPDVNGIRPGEVGYAATYAVNAAVAEVYRIKGARVAGDYNFTADDASFSKGDVLANLLTMETKYTQLAAADTSAATPSTGASTLNTSSRYGNVLDDLAAKVIP